MISARIFPEYRKGTTARFTIRVQKQCNYNELVVKWTWRVDKAQIRNHYWPICFTPCTRSYCGDRRPIARRWVRWRFFMNQRSAGLIKNREMSMLTTDLAETTIFGSIARICDA
jgi:hypothetical protein